jgi:heme/copper-type cytochrome/quinol oxidase subunit 3
MTFATPPRWAEIVLRLVLDSRDRATVSGDLLEEFRDSIWPTRGPSAADRWYVWQVMGFVVLSNMVPASLFGAAFVARTALDWLQPPADFHTRSLISTLVAASILLVSGFFASWKNGRILAGGLCGIATTTLAALLSTIGALALLTIWHDQTTLQAIEGSGGLGEVFFLPVMLIVPGVVLGTIGGLAGTLSYWGLHRRSS